jgi:hypothetical protein
MHTKNSIVTILLTLAAACAITLLTACAGDGTIACGPDLTCDTNTEVCVEDIGFVVSHRCAPIPVGCDDDLTCGCVQSEVCNPGDVCDEVDDHVISCCPKCGQATPPLP